MSSALTNQSLFTKPDIFEPETMYTADVKNKFGAQMLYIYQTNATVNVNMTEMTHPYANLGNDPLIKYQVQYFDFPTNNIVLFKDEIIYLYAYVTFITATIDESGGSTNYDQVSHVGMSADNYIGYPFIVPTDMVANSEELANFIRGCMKALHTHLQLRINTAAGDGDVRDLQMSYAFRMTNTFIFDNSTNKFGFVFSPTAANSTYFEPQYTDANITSTSNYRMYNVTYYIRVNPTYSSVRQQQIYKLFGGNVYSPDIITINDTENNVHADVYQISFTQNFSFGNGTLMEGSNYWQSPLYAIAGYYYHNSYISGRPSYPCANAEYFQNSLTGISSFISYAPQVATILPADFVYVRCSANTSNWDVTGGRKSNILAILPWSTGFGNSPEFGNNFLQTDVYGAVESITQVKAMTIFLTDEQGNLLQFQNPFTLKIAVMPI